MNTSHAQTQQPATKPAHTPSSLLDAQLANAQYLVGVAVTATGAATGDKISGIVKHVRGAMTLHTDPRLGRILVDVLSHGRVIPCELETVNPIDSKAQA